ncbi:MAG: LUD domain-containing protein [Candidatus Bathyarchaeia archaeon]|nr:LUD domain-containing protein [Candidatus Bathyarchaeota archaeon]
MSIEKLATEIIKAQKDEMLQLSLKRSIDNFFHSINNVLKNNPVLIKTAEHIKSIREKTLENIEYYIDKAIKSINATGAYAYFAKDRDFALEIVDKIIGSGKKVIVKAKSMVTEEIMLREYLVEKGHEVYETDIGEFLIQISRGKPMHVIVPALHLSRERVADLLRSVGLNVRGATHEEIVSCIRDFLKEKFIKADVGISGANAIAADTGSIFLVHNEGNISKVIMSPPIHIVIAGVEKIVPTFTDAMLQVMVQAGYAGLYPPTYIDVVSGISSTADIEYYKVYGVHGAKEIHVILYDGGRIRALKDRDLMVQLRCLKCGRCQVSCPIWGICGNIWGGRVYGGPMGIGWTAIVEGIEAAELISWFCLLCSACKELCPVKVDSAEISRKLRSRSIEKGVVPPKIRDMLENIYKHGNPFGLPRTKRSEWAEDMIPRFREGTNILYYVGDMGSFHPRAQKAARSLAEVLLLAGVSYGILGENENCSGSEAYEIGEMGLFEEMVRRNLETFNTFGVRDIVTLSPHSYNVMKNFYGDFGGKFNVKHYTQLLWLLIKDGRLRLDEGVPLNKVVAYHDSCFLGRWNGEYDAPRNILRSIPGVHLIELGRNRENSLCCGGGSGNSYVGFGCGLLLESEHNPNRVRVKEAYDAGVEILATACPLCLIMLEEAVKAESLEGSITIMDISEIVKLALRPKCDSPKSPFTNSYS